MIATASLPRVLAFAASGNRLDATLTTFTSADYTPTADGVTTTAQTFTAKDAGDAAVEGASVTFSLLPRFSISASESGVAVSPSSIPDDGLTVSVVTATLEDAAGNPLADTETGGQVTCAVSGTGNTVTSQGTITDSLGRLYWNVVSTTAEAKTITITAYGLALSTTPTLTVTGEVAPDVSDDFSTYTDTTDFRSDPLGLYDGVEETLTATYASVDLDTTVGYDALTQSMRMTFLDATAEGGSGTSGRCTNAGHSAWREIDVPASTTEMWLEVICRWSTDYSCGGGSWGCTSAPEHKWFLGGVSGGTSRFNLECRDGQYVFGYPGAETASVITSPRPDALFDDQWHVIRFHVRLGAANTGRARYWVDGVQMVDLDNVTIDRTAITTWSLGETRNQGAATNTEWWIGRWRMWVNANDPGW